MARSKVTKNKMFEMAVHNADYDMIVELSAQHRSKKNSFSFCEQLKRINEEDLNKLMKQLLKMLMDCIEKNLSQCGKFDWNILDSERCKSIVHFIQATTDICQASIQCDYTRLIKIELTQIAVFLHGIMLPMPESIDYVKNFISHYCEKLFSSGTLENCEKFLTNVVLYLVQKTLTKKANKNAVKRLYGIREVLIKILAQNGPKRTELWSLFVECCVSHTYLESIEGIKVIGLVMSLHPLKVLEIHEKIKFQLSNTPIKNATSYGKIYFEAWNYTVKAGNQQMRDIMEVTCIQQLILMAIQSEQKHILPIIRKVLNQFLIQKKDPEVSKMLHSVYQPVIWRYLKNPNGLYRACASQLLLDVFPLEDPDMRVVKNDMEITEQLLMIKDLLLDVFPIVRITTLLGICVSMSVNWEVFPEEMLKTFFRIIVNDLSRDSASPEVRVAVVKGMICLLENPLAVGSLVRVLPKLAGLFHDTSENVRLAFCQLLLKVKKISAIKYFEIVPINHLFARMEEDCHAVKKCLSRLLHNSYFPRDEDPKVWLGRCLEIIKHERTSSRIFFSYVSSFIGLDHSVKFMIQAAKAVHFYVRMKNSSSHSDMQISDKENIQSFSDYINTLEDAVGFGDITVVSTVMEAIACMWLSLRPDAEGEMMDDHKKIIKMLVGKLGPSLSELCLYYKDTEAWESVFYLSSFLPPSNVPLLVTLCFEKLRNLPADAEEPAYMALLECLANQFQMKRLLNIIKEWIEGGLSSYVSLPPPAKKRRERGESSRHIHGEILKPDLGIKMLHSILGHRNLLKHAILAQSALLEIIDLSDSIKRKIEKAQKMSEVEAEFLYFLLCTILRFAMHLHNPSDDNPYGSVPFVNEYLQWTREKLLKHIATAKYKINHFTSLIIRIIENLCGVLGDAIALGFFEPNNCLYLDYIYSVLNTGFGHKFLHISSKVLIKHAGTSQYMIVLEEGTIMMRHHLRYLNKIFDLINNEAILEKLTETELGEITFVLANDMHMMHNSFRLLPQDAYQTFKHVLKNILDCSAAKCADIVEEMAEDPFDRLSFPTTGNFFWSIISLKPSLIRTYMKCLICMFKNSQNVDISHWIAYWMITWSFLNHKAISQPAVREVNSMVLQLQKHIHKLYPRIKDSRQNDTQDSPEPVPLQLFQIHCYRELIKLKNRIKSKLQVKT